MNHAADLFGGIGVNPNRKAVSAGAAIPIDPKDPSKTVNLGTLPLMNPQTKLQFENMRNVLVPIIGGNSKKAHYTLFLQEFSKQLAKDLPSDQIKKIASTLTALSNEKMKEEKAADKGGKKSKAQKTKTSVVVGRTNPAADTATYEEDFGEYVITSRTQPFVDFPMLTIILVMISCERLLKSYPSLGIAPWGPYKRRFRDGLMFPKRLDSAYA